MTKLYNEEGEEVEAFTKEELDKLEADKKTEIETLQKELEETKKQIGNDDQKKRLKEAKEEAETKANEAIAKLSTELSELKETITGSIKSKVMQALSKGDKDVQEKIDLKYQTLMKSGDYKNDDNGITQALTEAATLVNGTRPTQGFLDNISGAGDRGAGTKQNDAKVESESSKAMRKEFKIDDATVEKYKDVISK